MKKFLLFALSILSVSFIFAQDPKAFIQKNNWMVGGRVMYSSQSQDYSQYDLKSNSFSLSPNVSYFPIDKLAVGIRLSYDTDKTEFGTVENKQTDFMIAPKLRYYFLDETKNINIYGEGTYGFGSSKNNDDEAESVSKYGVEAGLAWFCNPQVAMEFAVGYRSSKYELEDERANTIYFGIGFQIHLRRCGDDLKVNTPVSSTPNY